MEINPTQYPEVDACFLLQGPAGQLEVETYSPRQTARDITAIVCHPHPLQEGSMGNKVVTTLARMCRDEGIRAVRFNFRGVGASEGEFDNSRGEVDDLLAIHAWIQQVRPQDKIILAGFSFGAFIAASVAAQQPPAQLISIAPAVHHQAYHDLPPMQCPWVVVQGDADEVVPPDQVFAWIDSVANPPTLIRMADAGHFFHRRLIEMRELLLPYVSQL